MRARLAHAAGMTPLPFAAALFDLDGVLTSTATLHAACWKQTFEELSASRSTPSATTSPMWTASPATTGPRLPALPRDRASEALVREIGDHKQALVEQALAAGGVEAFEGSVRWVEQLRNAGVRTAVVSSSANARPSCARPASMACSS